MTSSIREYESIVLTLRIRRALHSSTTDETIQYITLGHEVLVYRESIGWDIPYTFLYRYGRLSNLLNQKGFEHLVHLTIIRPYYRPIIYCSVGSLKSYRPK